MILCVLKIISLIIFCYLLITILLGIFLYFDTKDDPKFNSGTRLNRLVGAFILAAMWPIFIIYFPEIIYEFYEYIIEQIREKRKK